MKLVDGKCRGVSGRLERRGPEAEAGLEIYRFKFVEPGKDLHMAFDGLVHVNGNWRIFPKPWRALGGK